MSFSAEPDIGDDVLNALLQQFFAFNPAPAPTPPFLTSPPHSTVSIPADDDRNLPEPDQQAEHHATFLLPWLPLSWDLVVSEAYTNLYNLRSCSRSADEHSAARSLQAVRHAMVRVRHMGIELKNEDITVDNVSFRTTLTDHVFRQKLTALVSSAENAYLDRLMQFTLLLLTDQPAVDGIQRHSGLMQGHHGLPVPSPVKRYIRSLLVWDPTIGYPLWHWHNGGDNGDTALGWFGSPFVQQFLYASLISPGWLGIQHICVRPYFTWEWEPLLQGTVEAASDALAMYAVCLKADFLREHVWDQESVSPMRQSAFDEEWTRIYPYLIKIFNARPIAGLSAMESVRAQVELKTNFLFHQD
ncbi:hypothetical protein HYDPIDRAFT_32121 [Hydnomerulius pinastri MD-312]|uniref:Uncharacterized protein n=1 Tax=Hydnomerulius pinastri MD-312 TaxID=994086 RepID=A0A0C9V5C5_9AGAM|nr:hypothetical protein HYDPIDRAFT_32121 [Hydnomerulius pinastri MD-312]